MTDRDLSPGGLVALEREEGVVLEVYPDENVPPVLTCGMGHAVRPEDNLHLGDRITQAQCDAFAREDVAKCTRAINAACAAHGVELSQNQFDACVSLAFNVGVAGFLSSTAWHDVLIGNLADEKRAFELWDKVLKNGQKVVSPALLARRDREVARFLTPDT